MANTPVTYKDSGVDIEAGDALVRSIKGIVKETHNASVLSNIGGFGGLFRPEFSAYEEPVLVSSVDGVGTKLNVSFMMEKYDTVGQDLVNHCVNDIAVCGAEPLFFLDYFATGKLKPDVGYEVIKGFTVACKENGCALIGGETAEMPGLYKEIGRASCRERV
jgi:phosphoribosylformylglycinamidine cyclo-ligase